MMRHAHSADRTARAHDPERGMHGLLRADAFQHRMHAQAVGKLKHAGDRFFGALGNDERLCA